ncbi:MAG: sugar ABC transporter ATP-binding protein [Vicinamibacterales bacterium]
MTEPAETTSSRGLVPRLEVSEISKRYGHTQALDGVSMLVAPGEVHALLGANGAGKSTLIKVLAGAVRPDSGAVRVDGADVSIGSPQVSAALGIGVIHQQLSILPSLTVAENFLMKRHTARRRRILAPQRQAAGELAAAALRVLGEDIDPDTVCERLSFGQRQMLEIAIAASSDVRVIVMDEPTSGLSAREQETLFAVIERLTARGISVIYVSHKMNEVYRLADTLTVIRGGRNAASFQRGRFERGAVVEAILGRRLEEAQRAAREERHESESVAVLEVSELRTERVAGISLSVRRGEVLGLYGVVGSGCTQVVEALFGARRYTGEIKLAGVRRHVRSTVHARRLGMSFVPADHHLRGTVPDLSVRENILMGRGRWRSSFVRRTTAPTRGRVEEMVRRLRVKCVSIDQRVAELSGGNQQKVVFGRAIFDSPKLLLLEDPTQGIDVGAKADMLAEIERQRASGAAVLLISSETSELTAAADRILILRDGNVVGELKGASIEERHILSLAADA